VIVDIAPDYGPIIISVIGAAMVGWYGVSMLLLYTPQGGTWGCPMAWI
jgi:thiamine biosynthesis protein ThiC